MKRRNFLQLMMVLTPKVWAMGLKSKFFGKKEVKMIKNEIPIDFQWPTQNPFLFCVHHFDKYPKGNSNQGLDSKYFSGRNIGQDFNLKDGFRLYHGKEIPGFPVHPHRGFETITIVRKGYVDHADSMGAAGRYGQGDVQWMTAGRGVQHSEMFPLLNSDKDNTLELFQIWLNLPKVNKMVAPDFKMLWANEIPSIVEEKTKISLINGVYKNHANFNAPKNSWAADKNNLVNIMLVNIEDGGQFVLSASEDGVNRTIYIFEGGSYSVNDEPKKGKAAYFLDPTVELKISAKSSLQVLILEAKNIDEPVEQYGPFVMNSRKEIADTIKDYQKDQFGGWPWSRTDMIHGSKIERFAKYPDGKIVKPN